MTAEARALKVRCPACGAAVAIAAGERRLACAGCGLDAALSQVGTAPGAALVALEPDLSGQALGDYALLDKIGAGGMGTVYRARGPHGDVAVKVLRPGLGGDRAAVRQRFARESAALQRLDHPRVVRLLDHGESDPGDTGTSYLVTELVTGEDLAARLARTRLPFAEIVAIFGQVCDGVAAAHAAGVVHRDLKPANILLGDAGAKVADFGLALLGETASVTTLTRTGVAMGTFHYLSPEQRKDAGAVDQRTDVWALGVIFYEMLTGELPVGSFAPASSLGPPGCDRRVDAIVRRALAPARADRYATVAELGVAVRALGGRSRARLAATVLGAVAFVVAGGVGIATVAGSGSGSGAEASKGKGKGSISVSASVAEQRTGTETGTDAGTGTGSDAGTGTGTGTGSVTGTDSVTGSVTGTDSVTGSVTGTGTGTGSAAGSAAALLDALTDPDPFLSKSSGKGVKPIGKRAITSKEDDQADKPSPTDATSTDKTAPSTTKLPPPTTKPTPPTTKPTTVPIKPATTRKPEPVKGKRRMEKPSFDAKSDGVKTAP